MVIRRHDHGLLPPGLSCSACSLKAPVSAAVTRVGGTISEGSELPARFCTPADGTRSIICRAPYHWTGITPVPQSSGLQQGLQAEGPQGLPGLKKSGGGARGPHSTDQPGPPPREPVSRINTSKRRDQNWNWL